MSYIYRNIKYRYIYVFTRDKILTLKCKLFGLFDKEMLENRGPSQYLNSSDVIVKFDCI